MGSIPGAFGNTTHENRISGPDERKSRMRGLGIRTAALPGCRCCYHRPSPTDRAPGIVRVVQQGIPGPHGAEWQSNKEHAWR